MSLLGLRPKQKVPQGYSSLRIINFPGDEDPSGMCASDCRMSETFSRRLRWSLCGVDILGTMRMSLTRIPPLWTSSVRFPPSQDSRSIGLSVVRRGGGVRCSPMKHGASRPQSRGWSPHSASFAPVLRLATTASPLLPNGHGCGSYCRRAHRRDGVEICPCGGRFRKTTWHIVLGAGRMLAVVDMIIKYVRFCFPLEQGF